MNIAIMTLLQNACEKPLPYAVGSSCILCNRCCGKCSDLELEIGFYSLKNEWKVV